MHERRRRLLFLVLLVVVFFQTGAHASQAFVNYPAWKYISAESFPAYHRVMTSGAALLAVSRVIELVLAIAALRYRPTVIKRWMLVLAIALTLCALLSTVLIQRPIHRQLDIVGNAPELLGRLQGTNWLRLVPEWIRAGLYFWMMSLLLRSPFHEGPTSENRGRSV